MSTFSRAILATILSLALVAPAVPTAQPESSAIEAIEGTGRRTMRLVCMGCAAAFIVASGTGSIAALAITASAQPELAAGCVYACIEGFSD
jgi:hypothetical protein